MKLTVLLLCLEKLPLTDFLLRDQESSPISWTCDTARWLGLSVGIPHLDALSRALPPIRQLLHLAHRTNQAL